MATVAQDAANAAKNVGTISGALSRFGGMVTEKGQEWTAIAIGRIKVFGVQVGALSEYSDWGQLEKRYSDLQTAFNGGAMGKEHLDQIENLLQEVNTNVTQTLLATLVLGAAAVTVMKVAHMVLLGWIPGVAQVSNFARKGLYYVTGLAVYELYMLKKAIVIAQDHHLKTVVDGSKSDAITEHAEKTVRLITTNYRGHSIAVEVLSGLREALNATETGWSRDRSKVAQPFPSGFSSLVENTTPSATPVKKKKGGEQ